MKLASKLIALAALFLAAPAVAADLPSSLPPPAPPYIAPLPAFTWTGFHVGANVGAAFGTKDQVGIHANPGNLFLGNVDILRPGGVFGGAQGGYDYQFGHIVVGAEADFQGASIDDSKTYIGPIAPGPVTSTSRIDFFGAARGRLGFAYGHFLVYGTGGFAYADLKYNITGGAPGGFYAAIQDRSLRTGYAAGGGIEYAFTNNISVKLEYQYIGFDKKTVSAPVFFAGRATRFSVNTLESPNFQTARIGVNYRF